MNAIPEIKDPEKYLNNSFVDSRFIELTDNKIFDIKMQYPLLGMKKAEEKCLVREEVYNMLLKAAEALPAGYKFRMLDAWRPFDLQHEIYEIYSRNIIKEFRLEDCSEEERNRVIRKYVSDPVKDRECPPVHTTGGAVDLTIIDADGNELDMGTGFDEFTDRTHTAYFEKIDNDTGNNDLVKENRRLLYHVMTSAGFTNLPSEWWHYDYGDRFWAYYKEKPAIYKGVFEKEEVYGCKR